MAEVKLTDEKALSPEARHAVELLKAKAIAASTQWAYYDGDHVLKYSAERLKDVFTDAQTKFIMNYCKVVVDTPLERIRLENMTVNMPAGSIGEDGQTLSDTAINEIATKVLDEFMKNSELEIDADDVHKAALVTGEAFVIVWPKDKEMVEGQGVRELSAWYNDPRLVVAVYNEENPHEMSYAAKWWEESSGHWRLTLYFPDRMEYYRTSGKIDKRVPLRDIKGWVKFQENGSSEWPTNDFGMIPVFHFRIDRRKLTSVLQDVITIQDAINKLFADMMVAAEFSAFRQRWMVTNADVDDIRASPYGLWSIPPADAESEGTQVGEFESTELQNYLSAIETLITVVSAITHIPRHFFMGTGQVPSGEALLAMESSLVNQVKRYIQLFSATWRKLGAFALRLKGYEVMASDIDIHFDDPITVQPMTEAEIRAKNREVLSLETTLEESGWAQAKIQLELARLEAEETQRQNRENQLMLQLLQQQQEQQRQEQEAAAMAEGGVDNTTTANPDGQNPAVEPAAVGA